MKRPHVLLEATVRTNITQSCSLSGMSAHQEHRMKSKGRKKHGHTTQIRETYLVSNWSFSAFIYKRCNTTSDVSLITFRIKQDYAMLYRQRCRRFHHYKWKAGSEKMLLRNGNGFMKIVARPTTRSVSFNTLYYKDLSTRGAGKY